MSDLAVTITERIHRRSGRIVEISFNYEETREERVLENMHIKHEKLTRKYEANITRDKYEEISNGLRYRHNVLSFDKFVVVLRLFMMSTYSMDEIREAFNALAGNHSNTIELEGLFAFVAVLHQDMTKEKLRHYLVKTTDDDATNRLNFQEFTQMVLKGIGRDIVYGQDCI